MARKFYNGIDGMAQKGQNFADGTAGTDLVTKQQLDNALVGLAWKAPVRAATTANGTLATAFANGQSLDGVTLATGDRILLKNQTAGAENGIYIVAASGAPSRAPDADSTAELRGATVFVVEGTANGDKAFTLNTDNVTVGTTAQVWVQFGGGGASYTASLGVELVGNDFRARLDGATLTQGPSGLKVTDGAFAKKFAANVGAMTAGTPLTITHNLNTLDVTVSVHVIATGEEVDLDVIKTGVNTITLTAAAAVSSGVLRVVVIG